MIHLRCYEDKAGRGGALFYALFATACWIHIHPPRDTKWETGICSKWMGAWLIKGILEGVES